ncbi:cyanobactin maturation protease PatG family protein [Endothiovibrio diazotrophicus]
MNDPSDRATSPLSGARRTVRDYYDRSHQAMARGMLPEQHTQQSVYLTTRSPHDQQRQTNLFLARRAGIRPGERILDAGCGSAAPAVEIARHYPGVRIEAVTLSPVQARLARERVHAAGLQDAIRVHTLDYHRLPFADGHFDRVLYLESLFHSDDLAAATAELFRVLRPNGTVYIKDMLRREAPLSNEQQRALDQFEGATQTRVLVASEAAAALKRAGLDAVEWEDLSDLFEARTFFEIMERRGLGALPVYWGDLRGRRPADAGAEPQPLFVLGDLAYDFGTPRRRDAFARALGGDPHEPLRMAAYLAEHPSAVRGLTWLVTREGAPLYALHPEGGFATEIHADLRRLLAGQADARLPAFERIERCAFAGRLGGRQRPLLSGQRVPELTLAAPRGLYGWSREALLEAALAAVPEAAVAPATLREALRDFLDRVYHRTGEEGRSAPERALLFAATNAVQSCRALADLLARGMELSEVEVQRSVAGRSDHDCWDIVLRAHHPTDPRRGDRVYRFGVDVGTPLPVTVGELHAFNEMRRSLA